MIKIDKKTEKSYYELIIGGDVDASSSIHLDMALSEALADNQSIIVNLEDLEYISSAGLGVFMSHLQDINFKKKKLAVFGMKEKVFQVFKILGLNQLMTIVNTKEEATSKVCP